MNLRCRKPRPLAREEREYRDDRFFVIATEDTHAPEQYFRVFRNTRIKVHVLPTKDGLSSPEHVLQRLEDFVLESKSDTIPDDEFWLMCDTDHWVNDGHVANLDGVCAQAISKGFQLAHSNPCFELWLLLHLTELNAGEQLDRCQDVERRLRKTLGQYSKQTIDNEQFSLEKAAVAVERAKKLDEARNDRWPQKTGSHVYRIVEQLL